MSANAPARATVPGRASSPARRANTVGDRSLPRLLRLLSLILTLQGPRRWSVEELAERYGVTRRTVYRDLAALQDVGVPVVLEDGGYRILETFRVGPVGFGREVAQP